MIDAQEQHERNRLGRHIYRFAAAIFTLGAVGFGALTALGLTHWRGFHLDAGVVAACGGMAAANLLALIALVQRQRSSVGRAEDS